MLREKLLKARPERSDRATAKLAKVDNKTVAAVRERLEATEEIPQLEARVGADGKERPAAKKSVAKDEDASEFEIPPPVVPSSPSDEWATRPNIQAVEQALAKCSGDERAYIWKHILPVYKPSTLTLRYVAPEAAKPVEPQMEPADQPDWDRLAKLLAMLSSDSEGERANAADAMKRHLEATGTSYVDLAQRLTEPKIDMSNGFGDFWRGMQERSRAQRAADEAKLKETFDERAARERRGLEEWIASLEEEIAFYNDPDAVARRDAEREREREEQRQEERDQEERVKKQRKQNRAEKREAKRLQEALEARKAEYFETPQYAALEPLRQKAKELSEKLLGLEYPKPEPEPLAAD